MQQATKIKLDTQEILLPYIPSVPQLIPHAKSIDVKGNKYLLVPHKPVESKLLRNLGFKVASPFLTHYDWNGTIPYEHQKYTSDLLVSNDRAYCLNDMGTGKTLSVLYAIDYLSSLIYIDKVLVVAPLSILSAVWEHETFRWMPHLDAVVLHGSRKKRISLLDEDHDIYIINHDGVETILPELLAKQGIDLVVLDELTAYKNAQTDRWKAMNKYIRAAPRIVWGLTGAPTPQAPTDAYGQVKLLTPANIARSFRMFQSETMVQVSPFTWIAKHTANDTVHAAMKPSIRYKLDDCITLPPITYSNIKLPLTTQQQTVYKEIMQKLYYQYQNEEVTAANEGVKMSKLLQIAAGFVYTTTKGAIRIDNKNRIDALCDLIDACPRKVIVFVPFRHGAILLDRELRKRKYDTAMIHGAVSKTKRDVIYDEFQTKDTCRVIIAHPRTMAHGLTLTKANMVVWFSPSPSLEIYQQANARVRRPSQLYKQYIIHLYGCAVEARIYKRLANKQKVQGSLLEMFESNTYTEI